MTRALFLAALACLAQPLIAQTKSAPAKPLDQQQLIEFYERQLFESEKSGNWEAIARRLAPDFLEIAGDGKAYTKEYIAKYFPDVKVTSYVITEMEFRSLGANAALLVYKIETQATFQGQPIPTPMRVSSVWVKQQGAWLLKFHQATLIPK